MKNNPSVRRNTKIKEDKIFKMKYKKKTAGFMLIVPAEFIFMGKHKNEAHFV
jgi:hypothetical protein